MSGRSHRRPLSSRSLLIATAVSGCITAAAVLARTVVNDIAEVVERVAEAEAEEADTETEELDATYYPTSDPISDPTLVHEVQTSVSRITVSPVVNAVYVALNAAELAPGDRLARDEMYVITSFQFRALTTRSCPDLQGLNLEFSPNGHLHFMPKQGELATAGYEHPVTTGEKVLVELEPGIGRRPGIDQGDRVSYFLEERLGYGGARLVLLSREMDDPVLRMNRPVPIAIATEHYLRLCWRRRQCWMADSGIVLENVELPRDDNGQLCAPSKISIGNAVMMEVIAEKVGNGIDPGFHVLGVWDTAQLDNVVIRVGDPVVLVFGDHE